MKTNITLVTLLIFSIALFFFIKNVDRDPLGRKVHIDKKPQEYMTHVAVSMYTKEGNLKNELSAKYWAYMPETQKSHLNTPHLTIYKPDGTIWYIDSKFGQIKQPTLGILENILLHEQVVIKRPETLTAIPILLETEELQYQPKEQYAESQKFIKLTKPGLVITGTGMRAFLEQGTVELLRDVKTYYTTTH